MKTIVITFLSLIALGKTTTEARQRWKRSSFQTRYPVANNLKIGGVDVETFAKTGAIIDSSNLYPSLSGSTSQYAEGNQYDNIPYDQITEIDLTNSNAVDKPVRESQEFIPNLTSPAIIPPIPPPAVPVNAVASNIPAVGNSVFLGSGSLGVVSLGGGAYALGSGALGYSERRSNPRQSYRAPLLPPVQAAPNLIPAAVNNPNAVQQTQVYAVTSSKGLQLPIDQNGYEYLPPDRVRFGDPLPMRPVKITNAYATPTALQIQSLQQPQYIPTQSQTLTLMKNQPNYYSQGIQNIYSTSTTYMR